MAKDAFVECGHSISPPETRIRLATGGMLTPADIDEPVAVYCGGEFAQESSDGESANDKCLILLEDQRPATGYVRSGDRRSVVLNHIRIGAASTVVNNGQTIWTTGGTGGATHSEPLANTEFVSIFKNQSGEMPLTNANGPDMPSELLYHCSVVSGREVVMVVGGLDWTKGNIHIS